MRKGNSSRDSTPETRTSSEVTVRGSSHLPRDRVGRFLEKVKGSVENGANKLRISRSKVSPSQSLVRPNRNHEGASSTSVQAGPSGVRVEVDNLLTLRDTQEAVEDMHSLSGHKTTVVSVLQGAQKDLEAADSFQDTYLQPLRIFDTVVGEVANLKEGKALRKNERTRDELKQCEE
ncbi:hypothetical protein BD769DRAFT_1774181 [Suillus cothurnatus]|nr:hypothetical protein BD769DRAFT_1774181 [Suillus cothurnatus]